MIFESQEYRVIAPLDPLEGGRYLELATDKILIEDVNHLYRSPMRKEDYINPTKDGMLSWRSISSYFSYSDTRLEKW
jgi:hypothetical protein